MRGFSVSSDQVLILTLIHKSQVGMELWARHYASSAWGRDLLPMHGFPGDIEPKAKPVLVAAPPKQHAGRGSASPPKQDLQQNHVHLPHVF